MLQRMVDYTDYTVKYVLISGISDEDIKKDVLGNDHLDNKSLSETLLVTYASPTTENAAIHVVNDNISAKLNIKTSY